MEKHVYLSVDNNSKILNYRGTAKDSDIEPFYKKMKAIGHAVISSDIPLADHSLSNVDGVEYTINYPSCFKDGMDTLFTKR